MTGEVPTRFVPEERTPDQRLWRIAGRWQTSGHVIGEPAIPVAGTDIYDVLPGGHFLVHHVDVTVGDQPVRAIEIIGEPDRGGGYLARSFDSEGNAEVMHLTIDDDGVFHFAGGGDIASAAQPTSAQTGRVRSTLRIASDRQSMTALWERSEDGSTWHRWMDITFVRSEWSIPPIRINATARLLAERLRTADRPFCPGTGMRPNDQWNPDSGREDPRDDLGGGRDVARGHDKQRGPERDTTTPNGRRRWP